VGRVAARGVEKPDVSAAHRAGSIEDRLLDERARNKLRLAQHWAEQLRAESAQATDSGFPIGDEEFVAEMELRLGWRLHS